MDWKRNFGPENSVEGPLHSLLNEHSYLPHGVHKNHLSLPLKRSSWPTAHHALRTQSFYPHLCSQLASDAAGLLQRFLSSPAAAPCRPATRVPLPPPQPCSPLWRHLPPSASAQPQSSASTSSSLQLLPSCSALLLQERPFPAAHSCGLWKQLRGILHSHLGPAALQPAAPGARASAPAPL